MTITSVKAAPGQIDSTVKFLSDFLPRLRKFPGVTAIYSYNTKDNSETNTLVIWENEDAVKAYWNSELINEPNEFVKKNNGKISREVYSLSTALK